MEQHEKIGSVKMQKKNEKKRNVEILKNETKSWENKEFSVLLCLQKM